MPQHFSFQLKIKGNVDNVNINPLPAFNQDNVAYVHIVFELYFDWTGINVAPVNTNRVHYLTVNRRKPYHHGNLRETLLEASIQLIAEIGPSAFTLREVARRAGVSHNAPYRHFTDKDSLLAAVAAQGYSELNDAMLRAANHHSDPLDRLKHAGLAYIAFALRRPEHFTVMFDAPFSKQTHPEAAGASERAFSTLLNLVKDCQDQRLLPPGPSLQFALLAWTMVHGIAKLATTDRLPYRSRAKILEFAKFVIDESLPKSSASDWGALPDAINSI